MPDPPPIAQRPDLVVANAEENRKLDVERLEAGGLAVFVTMPVTVAGAVAELRDLAAAVGDLTRAAAIDADLVAAVAAAYRGRPPLPVRYACAVWRDPWMWLGRRTYAADLLALAGGVPVLDDPATRYPRIEPDAVAALGPELVLLPSEPLPGPSARVSDPGSRRLRADGAGLTRAAPGAGFPVPRGLPGQAGSYVRSPSVSSLRATPGDHSLLHAVRTRAARLRAAFSSRSSTSPQPGSSHQ
jgi:hypothetical protein